MKIIFIGVFLLIGLILAFFGFAPEDRIYAMTSEYRRLADDQGQFCFDYHSARLKNSESGRYISSSSLNNSMMVRYKVRNEFGAYSDDVIECPLTNGVFDPVKVENKIAEAKKKIENEEKLARVENVIVKLAETIAMSDESWNREAARGRTEEVLVSNERFDEHIERLKVLTEEKEFYLEEFNEAQKTAERLRAELGR